MRWNLRRGIGQGPGLRSGLVYPSLSPVPALAFPFAQQVCAESIQWPCACTLIVTSSPIPAFKELLNGHMRVLGWRQLEWFASDILIHWPCGCEQYDWSVWTRVPFCLLAQTRGLGTTLALCAYPVRISHERWTYGWRSSLCERLMFEEHQCSRSVNVVYVVKACCVVLYLCLRCTLLWAGRQQGNIRHVKYYWLEYYSGFWILLFSINIGPDRAGLEQG